jgi:hypothetical protein
MMPAKSNGNRDRLSIRGRCLDCTAPIEIDECRESIDKLVKVDVPEIVARIDLVREHVDKRADAQAKEHQTTCERLELIAVAFEQHLATLSAQLGRIAVRHIAEPGAKP